jgi:hypothetical protein
MGNKLNTRLLIDGFKQPYFVLKAMQEFGSVKKQIECD